jgi:pantetheine-phosphate adenylyltransferase
MKVCIGGTFDIIHKGHWLLLDKAFEIAGKTGTVFIGVTTDNFVKNKGEIKSFEIRISNLKNFLENERLNLTTIKPINDKYGPTINGDFDAIIVSPETIPTAEEINRLRADKGKKPLKIIKIPFALADDGKTISSTRIRNGEIDKEGHVIVH